MKQIPETQQDIKKLLYEQVPLLIKKLEGVNGAGALAIIEAIAKIYLVF